MCALASVVFFSIVFPVRLLLYFTLFQDEELEAPIAPEDILDDPARFEMDPLVLDEEGQPQHALLAAAKRSGVDGDHHEEVVHGPYQGNLEDLNEQAVDDPDEVH